MTKSDRSGIKTAPISARSEDRRRPLTTRTGNGIRQNVRVELIISNGLYPNLCVHSCWNPSVSAGRRLELKQVACSCACSHSFTQVLCGELEEYSVIYS
jgi:hypothetical protein